MSLCPIANYHACHIAPNAGAVIVRLSVPNLSVLYTRFYASKIYSMTEAIARANCQLNHDNCVYNAP